MAAPANVADMVMIAEALAQALLQPGTLPADIGEEAVALDHLLHCERGGAGEGWPT